MGLAPMRGIYAGLAGSSRSLIGSYRGPRTEPSVFEEHLVSDGGISMPTLPEFNIIKAPVGVTLRMNL